MKRLVMLMLLLTPAGLATFSGGAARSGEPRRAESADQDVTFTRNLELLQVQMKLKTLEKLYGLGFYIPPRLVARYQEEQRQLLSDLHASAGGDFRGIDKWAQEQKKVATAEDLEMQKLVEKWGKKSLKQAGATVEEVRKFEAVVNQWRRSEKGKALALARYMEQFIKEKRGSSTEGTFADAMSQLYRGALKDTNNLVNGLVELQKQRAFIEGSQKVLGDLQKYLGQIDDFEKATADSIKERIDRAVTDYLQSVARDFDPKTDGDSIKQITSQLKTLGETAYKTWSDLASLDKDRTMNPTVRSAAKGFSVLAALYSYTFGLVKDLDEVKALGPFSDFIAFYGDALGLVPTIAQKMSALVARMDQDYLDVRRLAAFSQSVPADLGPFYATSLRNKFGIELGFSAGSANITREEAADRFYLVVPKTALPRGYATLSREQYERLAQTLADERLANAFGEAGRSVTDFALSFFRSDRDADALSSTGADSYLDSLKTRAKQTPFLDQPQALLDFARGTDARARRWETLRDARITALAEEMTILEALGRFRESDRQEWRKFTALLKKANVPLAGKQILNLFNYSMSRGDQTLLLRYLNREREARRANRQGNLKIGVPDVGAAPSDTIRPNSTATLTADVMVSGLPPGRSVQGEVTWTLPAWATSSTVRQTVPLGNGLKTVQVNVSVPRQLGEKSYPVTVEVKAAGGNGTVTARSTGRVEVDRKPPPEATTLVLTRVQYRIDKVTGTSSGGVPRDLSRDKEDEFKAAAGSIPVGYSGTWATGFARMNGSVTFGFPATLELQKQTNGRYIARGQVNLTGQASWSNKGLGFGRPTGIWIGSGTFFTELARDAKGSFANGSQSASASGKGDCTVMVNGPPRPGPGEWTVGTYTIRIEGVENRIVTLTARYKLIEPAAKD
jgi:hypothetical protein